MLGSKLMEKILFAVLALLASASLFAQNNGGGPNGGGGGGGGGISSIGITSSNLTVTGSPLVANGSMGVSIPNNGLLPAMITGCAGVGGIPYIDAAAVTVLKCTNLLQVNSSGPLFLAQTAGIQAAQFNGGTLSAGAQSNAVSIFDASLGKIIFNAMATGAAGSPVGPAVEMAGSLSSGFTSVKPTLSGACTTGTQVGGSIAGSFVSSTTGACAVTMAFPPNTRGDGFTCYVNDLTHPVVFTQTASSANTCSVSGVTTSGDVIVFMAIGY